MGGSYIHLIPCASRILASVRSTGGAGAHGPSPDACESARRSRGHGAPPEKTGSGRSTGSYRTPYRACGRSEESPARGNRGCTMREPKAEERTGSSAEKAKAAKSWRPSATRCRVRAAPSWSLAQEVVELLHSCALRGRQDAEPPRRRPAGRLHVVAASGLSTRELSRLALRRLRLPRPESLSRPHRRTRCRKSSVSSGGPPLVPQTRPVVGMVFVGGRTRRCSGTVGVAVLDVVAQRLKAPRAEKLGRSESELGTQAAALVRLPRGVDHVSPEARFRASGPREVQILELYGEASERGRLPSSWSSCPNGAQQFATLCGASAFAHARRRCSGSSSASSLLPWGLRKVS